MRWVGDASLLSHSHLFAAFAAVVAVSFCKNSKITCFALCLGDIRVPARGAVEAGRIVNIGLLAGHTRGAEGSSLSVFADVAGVARGAAFSRRRELSGRTSLNVGVVSRGFFPGWSRLTGK